MSVDADGDGSLFRELDGAVLIGLAGASASLVALLFLSLLDPLSTSKTSSLGAALSDSVALSESDS